LQLIVKAQFTLKRFVDKNVSDDC